jgi:signal transduction histidine kinase
MARSERLALVEDERAGHTIGPTARRPEPFAATPSPPVNDVGSGARGNASFDDVEDRMQQAFERKLLGPLSEIAETAALLEHQVNDVQAARLRAMQVTARRQSAMLLDVLAFVQTSLWGRVRVRRRPIDLRLLCERVVDAIQERYPDRAIALASPSRIQGAWDPDLVASLLSNLIVNAVEHGATSKAVRISLHAAEQSAVIEVANAGPPLDEEVATRLFEPFNFGRSTLPDAHDGLGLGLYVANEIARAHMGQIDAWNDPARGTTFRVTMPRA